MQDNEQAPQPTSLTPSRAPPTTYSAPEELDRAAVNEVFENLGIRMTRYFIRRGLNSDDANDAAGEVLRKIWEAASTMPEWMHERPIPWLRTAYKMAKGQLKHMKRQKMANVEYENIDVDGLVSDVVDINDRIAFETAVAGLPPPQLAAITLRLEGFKDDEAAEIMGVSYSSYTSHFQRAKKRLKRQLST